MWRDDSIWPMVLSKMKLFILVTCLSLLLSITGNQFVAFHFSKAIVAEVGLS